MTTADALIQFDAASVAFAERRALTEVTVELSQRRIGVIGSNGSGKSTFARLLNGLITPTSGTIRVHGHDPVRDGRALRRLAGFVFSNPDVQVIMPTVAEDVAFSLRGRGLAHDEMVERVSSVLERVGLAAVRDEAAHTLSGGQKQLLALAGVLVSRPSLVIADEPTAFLDAANTRRIAQHLLDDPEFQVVLVTHDLGLATRCDVVLRFEGGRLVEVGTPTAVVAAYRKAYA